LPPGRKDSGEDASKGRVFIALHNEFRKSNFAVAA
jgi:hypothetical protein